MAQQGEILAELKRQFHGLRPNFLRWTARQGIAESIALAHFRRALIGWYEARIDPEDPYLWEIDEYVKHTVQTYLRGDLERSATLADMSPMNTAAPGTQNPADYLPRPVHPNDTQRMMLTSLKEQGTRCRELLLMLDYHRLTHARVAEILGIDGMLEEVRERRQKCMLMIREGWQAVGLVDPQELPSPVDEELIDRYFAGQLDLTERWAVESRRPVDAVFRRAMELREDWNGVILLAGRQDLMATLQSEEASYASQPTTAPATAPKDVKLSPRTDGRMNLGKLVLPNLQTIVAVLLLAVFGYLAWTTFGDAAPQRRALAHFEPYPNIFDARAPATEQERDLQRILYYYDRRDYQTAYEELLPVAPAYPAAELYLGVSALALGDAGRALEWLEQIPPDAAYAAPGQWYEAVAFLAQGRTPAAAARLEDISATPGHPYRSRAAELLADL